MAKPSKSTATVLVYVTAPSARDAERIGAAVVGEGLAACANVLGPIRSVFRWKGKIERARESVLIMKTQRTRVPALTRRIKALHAYEVPCVVALPILGGNPDFLTWIGAETAPKRAARSGTQATARRKARARS